MLLRGLRRGMDRSGTAGLYYGWPMLIGLSVAETVSWGILYYSFSVFIRPMEAELGWSRAQVTGAFSIGLLVAGLAAIPVGHWLDRRGARGLMTAGGALGALLLVAFSRVSTLPAFYAIWAGLGVAMAMVLYEPAFAVVATWFVRHRNRALTILTVFGGLASTVMVPLSTWLLERQGWRGAVLALAGLLACTTIPLHGLLLRKHPSDVGQQPDGEAAQTGDALAVQPDTPGLGPVMAEGRFWGLTVAFMLASLVTVATSVHVIPYLIGRGVAPATAAVVLGAMGLMQLPGRLVFGPIRRCLTWQWTAAAVFVLQASALVLLARAHGRLGLAAFVCLFGAGNGMNTLLRASTLADLYGPERYGRVSGVLALFGTAGRAAGPLIVSFAYVAAGSYEWALGLLVVLLGLAVAVVLVPWKLPQGLSVQPLPRTLT